jgi:hypothetical protein
MKTKNCLVVFFFGLFAFACLRKSKKVIVSDVSIEAVEYDSAFLEPPPPPPSIHFSTSMTLEECFVKLAAKEHPRPDDTAYNCGIYQINKQYVIFFIESKAYKKNAEEWMIKKGSEFIDKYYPIANREFESLSWKQVLEKIRAALQAFSKTAQFERSSLAKAQSITIHFDDAVNLKIK